MRYFLAGVLALAACGGSSSNPPPPVLGPAMDRVGRSFTSLTLAAPFAESDVHADAAITYKSGATNERTAMIAAALGELDALDGVCGNQLAGLAARFADDRLLIDSTATRCDHFFALETETSGDCGGLTPLADQPDVLLSYLAGAAVSDGVDRDADGSPSLAAFPFLLAPK